MESGYEVWVCSSGPSISSSDSAYRTQAGGQPHFHKAWHVTPCIADYQSAGQRSRSPSSLHLLCRPHDCQKATMPPKGLVTIAKNPNSSTNGVLAVSPAIIQNAPAKTAIRLKLEVRRLPPGLTKHEFEQAFGDEWKLGAGKVDWLEYRQGKVKR